MRFMRGKYVFDEVGDGKDELEFRENGATFMSIRIREDRYDFHIDGECIPVADLEAFETVKRLVLAKKEPNRKPFPKEGAVYSDCGHRCDLCVHYRGGIISEELRAELKERLIRVYCRGEGVGYWGDDMILCDGCAKGGFGGEGNCEQKKCAAKKGVSRCPDCGDYDACNPEVGYSAGIELRSILADDVTLAILPYVHRQYGN